MSGDSSRIGGGSPPGVFARAPAEAQTGLTALAIAVADAEQRVAEVLDALDERSSELAHARLRIATLENTLAQRNHDLALRLQRMTAIKPFVSWVMAPFRELYRPIRRLRRTRFGVRLRAAWRHPMHSHKRKAFRANRMEKYAAAYYREPQRPSKLAAKLRALLRYPFSPGLRRAHRELLRRDPPPPPLPPSSRVALASLIDFSSRTVSAIVPNYNHGRFLKERLASIAEQTHSVLEIIILDDASTDNSRDLVTDLMKDITIPVRTIFNEKNSGSVFSQWAKGLSLATGDLIWICESDDTCERDFLEVLVPYFADQSIMLAFGRIDFIEENGSIRPGMAQYMESAAAHYWDEPRIESAHTWFQGPFGIRNVIPNVGGCIFRRQQIASNLLQELTSYKVCGDWHLYTRLAHGGQIAYDPKAHAYFRQHGRNTSVSNFKNETFYDEHMRIARALRRHSTTDAETSRKMLSHVYAHYRQHFGADAALQFESKNPLSKILSQRREIPHILISMLGFQTGGGEMFPIHLANAVSQMDYDVSVMIALPSPVNVQMRKLLRPEIPIFTKSFLENLGVERFLREFSVDLIHTHNVGIDKWLHWLAPGIQTPYVVTHHGSYECEDLPPEVTTWLLKRVDQWIYIADKNIAFTDGFSFDQKRFTKLSNALPVTASAFGFSRQDLGIEADAFVFGLASRAIRSKGWDTAIESVSILQRETARPVHLILCGDGEDLDALRTAYKDRKGIHFLGFQEEIQAFYRLCDCCVLPTRFPGESYPLTIIEAILAGVPTIATNLGEIPSIIKSGAGSLGIVVPRSDDDAVFMQSILHAMRRMLVPEIYGGMRVSVAAAEGSFSMDKLVRDYLSIYERALSRTNLNRRPSMSAAG